MISMEKSSKIVAGKVLEETCCADAYFLHLIRSGKEILHPFLSWSLDSTYMTKDVHLSLLQSQGFCGLVKNNTVVLLQEFYDNGICIYLCNYSQGHIKSPDRGVCSCTHGKLTEVKKKLLR